ncbi:MAG: molybdenum cofactor biosynthesis protein MoaE, partial [Roseimicrobium sp.]
RSPAYVWVVSAYTFTLTENAIRQEATVFTDGEGADVQFLGTVRAEENGKLISGIEYSAYRPMADRELERLCHRAQAELPPHRVEIEHRLGFVPAREPSILIRVKTRHSAEGFDLCRWYLREIKTSVPIWKKAVWV